MARHKTPDQVKELTGAFKKNPGRRANAAPPAVFETPKEGEITKISPGPGQPPDNLTDLEQAAWFEILNQTYPGVIGISDRLALELMARLVVEMRTNYAEMPAAKVSRLETLLARFGMTPADRQRIAITKETKKNKFAALDS